MDTRAGPSSAIRICAGPETNALGAACSCSQSMFQAATERGGPRGKRGTPRPAPTGAPQRSDRRHKMVGATMDSDDLLKRVRAIPGVMEASIMHGRQRDRLYVKVASGDAN